MTVFLEVPKRLKEAPFLLREAPEPLQVTRRRIAIEEQVPICMGQTQKVAVNLQWAKGPALLSSYPIFIWISIRNCISHNSVI
jgi:hypothetical protein